MQERFLGKDEALIQRGGRVGSSHQPCGSHQVPLPPYKWPVTGLLKLKQPHLDGDFRASAGRPAPTVDACCSKAEGLQIARSVFIVRRWFSKAFRGPNQNSINRSTCIMSVDQRIHKVNNRLSHIHFSVAFPSSCVDHRSRHAYNSAYILATFHFRPSSRFAASAGA
jgi:hypothetical protein